MEEKTAVAKAVALADWGESVSALSSGTNAKKFAGTAGRFYQVRLRTIRVADLLNLDAVSRRTHVHDRRSESP